MEDNKKSELKVLSVIHDLYEEIDSHRAMVMCNLNNEASFFRDMLNKYTMEDDVLQISKEDYNKLYQFINRLSSYDQNKYISSIISEHLSDIKYKRDLINKLK